MDTERVERTEQALYVMDDPQSTPGQLLREFLLTDESRITGVVAAVAVHYGSAYPDLWEEPVEDALMLLAGVYEGE